MCFSGACGIKLNGNFIVTGGWPNATVVAEFTATGEVTYLASLQTGRLGHACTKFQTDNGETVSLIMNFSPHKGTVVGFSCHRRTRGNSLPKNSLFNRDIPSVSVVLCCISSNTKNIFDSIHC